MSIMACNREGCTNTMCDHYSTDFGYICNECLDELINNDNWLFDIGGFMGSSKGDYKTSVLHRTYVEGTFTLLG